MPEPAAVESSQDAVVEEQAAVEDVGPIPPAVPAIEIAASASGTYACIAVLMALGLQVAAAERRL